MLSARRLWSDLSSESSALASGRSGARHNESCDVIIGLFDPLRQAVYIRGAFVYVHYIPEFWCSPLHNCLRA